MKKIIYNSLLSVTFIFFLFIGYLSFFGIETDRFNKQITNKIKNINNEVQFELKKVKLILEPLKIRVKVKTLGPKLKSNNETLNIESIETYFSLKSLFLVIKITLKVIRIILTSKNKDLFLTYSTSNLNFSFQSILFLPFI